MSRIILIAIAILLLSCPSAYSADTEAALEEAYCKAVSGDVRPVFSVFDSIENVTQSGYADLYEKYRKRFVTVEERIEFDDPFITRLYDLYTAYWRSSLLDPGSERKAGKTLVSGLARLAKSEGRETPLSEYLKGPNADRLGSFLIETARKKGYHLLLGRTLPLWELMIWKKEEVETYSVEISSGHFPVKVVFLQDFLTYGWLGYATFDKKHTGGWANTDAIYRVGEKPGADDEWFQASLLGHEGQHVSDKKRYGDLPGWILEYRAKTTELLSADQTFQGLLNAFKQEAKDDASVPHVYASYRLLMGLMKELKGNQEVKPLSAFRFEDFSQEETKKALKRLLDESTQSLDAKRSM
jgi:hypothetical protein